MFLGEFLQMQKRENNWAQKSSLSIFQNMILFQGVLFSASEWEV